MKISPHISIFKSALLFLTLFLSLSVHSQTYPVQTSLSTTGPYFNYLSYYSDQNNHLQAVVTLTDFNSPPIEARMRIRIEGPGYELITNPSSIVGNAFTLNPGVPTFLQGIDFAPYFQSQSLIISPSGLDINKLPEGFTTICVDIIRDGVAAEVISTNNCTSFFLQRFQPPQAFVPVCESSMNTDELFHTFQWTPPVGYVPTIGSELTYTFSLHEWNDPNNYTIFETGQGLVYSTQTNSVLLQLSDFDLTLQEATNYVWRVQAQITNNGMPVDMIENNGLSEICTFIYGESQSLEESLSDGLLIDLNASGNGEMKGNAYWTVIDNTPSEGLSAYNSYLVTYRKKPTGNEGYEFTWFNDTVFGSNHDIFQLEANTTYQVKVSGIIGNFTSEPTDIVEFTTASPRVYSCGEQDMPFLPSNYNPLLEAQVGMSFQIGQFKLKVTEISPFGALGHYSGKGSIPVAFLGGARTKVRFDDILVDDQFNVRQGVVNVVTKGLDNWLNEQYMQFIDPYYVSGTVSSAGVDTTTGSAWVVVDGQTLTYTFNPPDYPIIVNDDSGNQYTIWPNGLIEVSNYLDFNETWEVDSNQVLVFKENSSDTRGFDQKEFMQWHENYQIMLLNDSIPYFVPNKSLAEGELGTIDFDLPSDNSLGPISYKIDQTTEVLASGNSISLPNDLSKGEHSMEAYAGNQKVGQVNLFVYSQKEKQVIIVPIASVTPDAAAIKTILDQTLGQANLNVSVTVAPQWNDTLFTTSKTIALPEDVGLLNKYSLDMRSLRDAYFDDSSAFTEEGAYYIFVVPGFDDAATEGYMVRGKALGFVASSAPLLTYGHELAHGLGALNHSWKDNGPEQGATSNLMDYASTSSATPPVNHQLTKAQWKELRDFDLLPSLWDEVEDATSLALNGNITSLLSTFVNPDSSLTFISPAGQPITIKGNITQIKFATYEDQWYNTQTNSSIPNTTIAIGSLISFTLDGKYYSGKASTDVSNFIGFSNGVDYYIDSLTQQNSYTPLCVLPSYSKEGFSSVIFQANQNTSNYIILKKNKGEGPVLETWALKGLMENSNIINGIKLTPNLSQSFSLSTLSILNELLYIEVGSQVSFDDDFYGYDAMMIFNVAYYIENKPSAASCYSEFDFLTKKLVKNDLIHQYASQYDIDIINQQSQALLYNESLGLFSDNLKPLNVFYPWNVGEYEFNSPQGQLEFKKQRLETVLRGLKFYDLLMEKIDSLSSFSNIETNTLISLIKSFEEIEGLGSCFLKLIPPESKLELLNRITDYSINNDKEELLVKILENTSDAQFAVMYQHILNDNCNLLHILNDGIWYSLYDRFANTITRLILTYKKAHNYSESSLPIFPLFKDGTNPFDSKVEYDFSSCNINFDAKITGFWNNEQVNFHPADLVKFVIADHFDFPGYNGALLRKGDTLIAPAFWGYYFLSEHAQHTNLTLLRITAEAILIVATGFSAAPGIIEIELGLLGSQYLINCLQDSYPNNQVLDNISLAVDALSIIIPITGTHAIIKNGIANTPWFSISKVGTRRTASIIQEEFNSFLIVVKQLDKENLALTKIGDLIASISNSGFVSQTKQTLLTYLLKAEIELRILQYTSNPTNARLAVNSGELLVEVNKTVGSYTTGQQIIIGKHGFANGGDYFYNLQLYDESFGNVSEELLDVVGVAVLENGEYITKSYKVVATENGIVCLRSLANGVGRFIAKSGDELKTYLNGITDLPVGVPYSGKLYRYKSTGATYSLTDINPYMNPLENRFKTGLYASTSKNGNLIEVNAYGGTAGKTQYEISNVQLNNVLDLTDEATINQLGTSFEQMKLSGVSNKYEYTHEVADWAKSKGYSGVKFYGAQGSGTVYENIIVFEQSTVNNSIINSSINPVSW